MELAANTRILLINDTKNRQVSAMKVQKLQIETPISSQVCSCSNQHESASGPSWLHGTGLLGSRSVFSCLRPSFSLFICFCFFFSLPHVGDVIILVGEEAGLEHQWYDVEIPWYDITRCRWLVEKRKKTHEAKFVELLTPLPAPGVRWWQP